MRTWLSKSLMGPHKLERPIGPESSASDLEVKRGQYAARSSKCAIKLRVSHPPKHIPPLSRRILSKIVAGFCASFCTLFFSYSASGLEVRVAASTDDAEEKPSGSMSLTSSDIELVFDGSDQTVGMRFNAVTIPPGAAITNAYIQFQVDEANSEATSLVIEG
ncbi:MAG: fibronectin type III domain-containing protein, partial [candidate division NC10 bacterium CSP1-5]